jgi:hypothetical protein
VFLLLQFGLKIDSWPNPIVVAKAAVMFSMFGEYCAQTAGALAAFEPLRMQDSAGTLPAALEMARELSCDSLQPQ